jgi:hypothetical protein
MRLGVVAVLLAFPACGPEPAAAPRDPLILVVGGDGHRLRDALARSAPPPRVAEQPPRAEPAPREQPPPREEPPPAERSLRLEAGMTLYSIARAHLPGRPQDGVARLLAKNGWTEAQASRLPIGTLVRLP